MSIENKSKLTTEEKQAELERHYALLVATVDYVLQREFGSIVYDGNDQMKEFYEITVKQNEKYYSEQNLDKIKCDLDKWLNGMRSRADLQFASYIKEKNRGRTGFVFGDRSYRRPCPCTRKNSK